MINTYPVKLIYYIFQPLEVVSRYWKLLKFVQFETKY